MLTLNRCISSIVRPLKLNQVQTCWFQSPAHTDNLYPGSSIDDRFKIQDIQSVAPQEKGKFSGYIPMNKLQITAVEGRDGLNILGKPTKIDIRFHLDSADWLDDDVKKSLKETMINDLSKDGYLVVKSDRTRSQMMNQADALRKLRDIIWMSVNSQNARVKVKQQKVVRLELNRRDHFDQCRSRLRIKK